MFIYIQGSVLYSVVTSGSNEIVIEKFIFENSESNRYHMLKVQNRICDKFYVNIIYLDIIFLQGVLEIILIKMFCNAAYSIFLSLRVKQLSSYLLNINVG